MYFTLFEKKPIDALGEGRGHFFTIKVYKKTPHQEPSSKGILKCVTEEDTLHDPFLA